MVDLTQLDMLSPIVPNIYDKTSFVIGGALHGPVQLKNNIQYRNGKYKVEAGKRKEIVLGSLNVQTLGQKSIGGVSAYEEDADIVRLPIIMKECTAAGFECVVLQETRVRRKADGSNPLIMSGAYKVLFSGVAKIGEGSYREG